MALRMPEITTNLDFRTYLRMNFFGVISAAEIRGQSFRLSKAGSRHGLGRSGSGSPREGSSLSFFLEAGASVSTSDLPRVVVMWV